MLKTKLAQYLRGKESQKNLKMLFCLFMMLMLVLQTFPAECFGGFEKYGQKLELFSENYLKLTYYACRRDVLKKPVFADTMVQSEPGKYVEDAVMFLTGGDYSQIEVSLYKEPERSAGEKFAIYTIEGDRLLKRIDSDGAHAEISVNEAQGLALVKEFHTVDVIKQEINVEAGNEVTLSFKGYMPPNASIRVDELECDGDDVIHNFDITITDENGNEFQPLPGCPIDVKVESEKIRKSVSSGKLLEAEHVRDDGTIENIGLTLSSKGVTALSASGFSKYKIKEHGSDPLVTPRRFYHFLDYYYTKCDSDGTPNDDGDFYRASNYVFQNKAGDDTNVQIIKSGDELEHVPIPPNRNNQYFFGWYVIDISGSVDNDTIYQWKTNPERVVLGKKIVFSATEDTHIYLVPMYSNYRLVTFHEGAFGTDHAANILTRKLVSLGDSTSVAVKISDVRAQPLNAKQAFWGWSLNGGPGMRTVNEDGSEIESSITVSKADSVIDIYPVFHAACWIHFNSGGNGAKYIPSRFLLDGESVSKLSVTMKPGYKFNGWFADENYSNCVADKDGNIVSNDTTNDAYQITGGTLTLQDDMVLYAKWTRLETTSYTVVYWQQKVTDPKNAKENEKAYDYWGNEVREVSPGYVINENQDVDKDKDFEGFTYSRYSVNNNGIVEPDGSTVLNVYYNRKLMLIDFFFRNGEAPSGGNYTLNSTPYVYTIADSSTGTQYGFNGLDYKQIVKSTVSEGPFYYYHPYKSTLSSDGTQYVIVNGEYVELQKGSKTGTTELDVWKGYTCTQNNDATFNVLGIQYGEYWPLKRISGGRWLIAISDSSDIYSGDRYTSTVDSEYYEGPFYKRTELGVFEEVSDPSTSVDTQYYTGEDQYGAHVDLTHSTITTDVYEWFYNGNQIYNGTRYVRMSADIKYTGRLYKKGADGSFTQASDSDTGILFGLVDGTYVQLEYKPVEREVWKMDEVEYTGQRYTRSTVSTTYKNRMTWSGLYGSTFASNGYDWADVSSFLWRQTTTSNGTAETMLDSFSESQSPYDLYSNGLLTVNSKFYHYKQNLNDELYNSSNCVVANSGISSGKFNFMNKFQGFTVDSYTASSSSSSASFSSDGGTEKITLNQDGKYTVSNLTYPLRIYHRRNKYDLNFFDTSKTGDAQTVKTFTVPYEYEIGQFPFDSENTINDMLNRNGSILKPEKDHYNFLGWFADPARQHLFDFTSLMPAAAKAIYGIWEPMQYLVRIDPNGGVFDHSTTPYNTYSWLEYGSTIEECVGISREYVPSDSGEYVYLNVTFNGENSGKGVSENLRNAVYLKKTDLDTYYDNNYKDSGMSREAFDSCVSTQCYSKKKSNELYTLLGWFRETEDGTLESTPYNFLDQVSSDITIRAKWSLSGKFRIIYQGDMTVGNETVRGEVQEGQETDPPSIGSVDESPYYKDQADTVVLSGPTGITDGYSFVGWRIVDASGKKVLSDKIFSPGDTFTIDSKYADESGNIRLQAYYEKEEEGGDTVSITQLVLDANSGTLNKNGLEEGKYLSADTTKGTLSFKNRPNNTDIDLSDYSPHFTHPYGCALLGWSRERKPEGNQPDFFTDDVIGIDKNEVTNTLYAVWEKTEMFLTLKNDTSEPIDTNISFPQYSGQIYKVNGAERPIINQSQLTLNSGDELTLAIGLGTGTNYIISGEYSGSKDEIFIRVGSDEAQQILKGGSYNLSGEMESGPPGPTITFYEKPEVAPPTAAHLGEKYNRLMIILSGLCLTVLLIIFLRSKEKLESSLAF